jgi:hypothetical protein
LDFLELAEETFYKILRRATKRRAIKGETMSDQQAKGEAGPETAEERRALPHNPDFQATLKALLEALRPVLWRLAREQLSARQSEKPTRTTNPCADRGGDRAISGARFTACADRTGQ